MSGALDNSPAAIIRSLLIEYGHGVLLSTTPDGEWPIFVGNEPDTPDNCITLYNTQGKDNGRKQITGGRIEYHGFQVRVRGFGETVAYLKARDICIYLDEDIRSNIVTITVNTYVVNSVMRSTDAIPLGKQTPSNKLDLFTINALVSLRQTS